MNTAIIIAGGSGRRMGQDIPKQFISVYDRPVLIYTMESFQKHPQIEAIEVVCLEGWADVVWAYAKQFGMDKLKWVISGGGSAQDSIRAGVENLRGQLADDDMVVIHDGVRPLIDEAVLTNVIVTCSKYGNGVSSMPYNEQIFIADDELSTTKYIPRETLRRVVTPQAYRYGVLRDRYREAYEKGIGVTGSAYANTMMVELGERLYFAPGSDKNIKLTTSEDLEMFKAYVRSGTI
jgi:2-C-methyl-D-erythritol 4-phosphate cytidylyltransferase